jgi:hypothetical protein
MRAIRAAAPAPPAAAAAGVGLNAAVTYQQAMVLGIQNFSKLISYSPATSVQVGPIQGVIGDTDMLAVDNLRARGMSDSHGAVYIPAGTRNALRLASEAEANKPIRVGGTSF